LLQGLGLKSFLITNGNSPINLQGILVGNGVTDWQFDGNSWIPFIWGHSFIPDTMYNDINAVCDGNFINSTNMDCDNLLNNASNLLYALNIYDVYVDCYNGPSMENADPLLHDLFHRVTSRVRESAGLVPPCVNADRATAYLNLPETRVAFNAIPVTQQNWTICTIAINYTSIYDTVIPVHEFLLQYGIRILVYSGDADMCVPNTGSEAWTASLGLPIIDAWRPWFVNSQVAGYVQQYKGLTYATIKGAGHMVPQYKPPQALHFFTNFLNNQPF